MVAQDDRLERLRRAREASRVEPEDSASKLLENAGELVKDTIMDVVDTPATVPRDSFEQFYLSIPNWLEATLMFVAVLFFSWFLGGLLFREARLAYNAKGAVRPVLRLGFVVFFLGFIWLTLWTLVSDGLVIFRNVGCGVAAFIGLLNSFAEAKERGKALLEAAIEALKMQGIIRRKKKKKKKKNKADEVDEEDEEDPEE